MQFSKTSQIQTGSAGTRFVPSMLILPLRFVCCPRYSLHQRLENWADEFYVTVYYFCYSVKNTTSFGTLKLCRMWGEKKGTRTNQCLQPPRWHSKSWAEVVSHFAPEAFWRKRVSPERVEGVLCFKQINCDWPKCCNIPCIQITRHQSVSSRKHCWSEHWNST